MTLRAVSTDIDGVLHSTMTVRIPEGVAALAVATPERMRQMGLFCWTAQLEEALRESEERSGDEIMLVIHSTWRQQPWVRLQALREALGPLGNRLMGMTSPDLPREASILDLMKRAGVDDFLVLDDARAEFSPGIEHLVITNPLCGVSDPAVLSAVREWACAPSRHCRTLPVPVL